MVNSLIHFIERFEVLEDTLDSGLDSREGLVKAGDADECFHLVLLVIFRLLIGEAGEGVEEAVVLFEYLIFVKGFDVLVFIEEAVA